MTGFDEIIEIVNSFMVHTSSLERSVHVLFMK